MAGGIAKVKDVPSRSYLGSPKAADRVNVKREYIPANFKPTEHGSDKTLDKTRYFRVSPKQVSISTPHCLRNHPGGVTLLAINADRTASQNLDIPAKSERYTLTAKDLLDNKVELNGSELKLEANGDLPQLTGKRQWSGHVAFAPVSITFLAIPTAKNAACP